MKQKHNITALPVLLTTGLFALCAVLVLLTGARVYRVLVDRGRLGYEQRTAVQYVTTRVRQAETVDVEDFDGCQSLTMAETVEGATYLTRIYCQEGFLRELYCPAGAVLGPEDGEKVLPLTAMEAEIEDGLLRLTLDGEKVYLYLPVA